MWQNGDLGFLSRGMALYIILIFLCSTAIGSMAPEFGNLVAKGIGVWSHFFNKFFLALAIIGIGVALYLGYRMRS